MLASVEVEDQDGRRTSLLDELETRPVIVAFYYTLLLTLINFFVTVSGLVLVEMWAVAVFAARLSVLGVTYDPAFDAPERLAAYGRNRAFPFSGSARLLRAEKGWSSMRIGFDLQVGYGGATVNDHAREAFLISSGLLATPIDPEALARPEELVRRALEPSATT